MHNSSFFLFMSELKGRIKLYRVKCSYRTDEMRDNDDLREKIFRIT